MSKNKLYLREDGRLRVISALLRNNVHTGKGSYALFRGVVHIKGVDHD